MPAQNPILMGIFCLRPDGYLQDRQIRKFCPPFLYKNGLIVVYCWSAQYPASGWLYDKLVKLGYTSPYEYHGGIQEWKQLGYTTVKQ